MNYSTIETLGNSIKQTYATLNSFKVALGQLIYSILTSTDDVLEFGSFKIQARDGEVYAESPSGYVTRLNYADLASLLVSDTEFQNLIKSLCNEEA